MAEPLIRDLEALRVKPGEVLIIRVPVSGFDPDTMADAMAQLREAVDQVGLAGRTLVLAGDIELTVAEPEA